MVILSDSNDQFFCTTIEIEKKIFMMPSCGEKVMHVTVVSLPFYIQCGS